MPLRSRTGWVRSVAFGGALVIFQTLKPGARIMRYELADFEWAAIEPMLPNKPRGVPRVNDRRVLNGIFWVLRRSHTGRRRCRVCSARSRSRRDAAPCRPERPSETKNAGLRIHHQDRADQSPRVCPTSPSG
jgi:hypothetical protein